MSTPPDRSKSAAAEKPARPRRWWRRLRVALICVVGLALVFRLLLLILLPTVIASAARYAGVDCSYKRMELSLLGTNAALWDVQIKTKDRTQDLLRTDFVYASFSTWELFRLRLVAWRLEADGVRAELVRKPDGTVPLLDALRAAAGAQPSGPPPAGGVDFSPPLMVHDIRLHDAAVHVRDESVSPPFDTTVDLDLRVSDLGDPGRPAHIGVDVTSGNLFDSARAEGDLNLWGDTASADVAFSLRGLRADQIGAYLASAGVAADGRSADLAGKAALTLRAVRGSPGVLDGSAAVEDLSLRVGSEELAALGSVSVQLAALSPSLLHVSAVRIEGGRLLATRSADGTVSLGSLSAAAGPPAPSAAGGPQRSASAFGWRVDELTIEDCEASLVDRAVQPANAITARLEALTARGLRSDGPPDSKATVSARLSLPRLAASVDADAEAEPFAPSPRASLALRADGVSPEALAPYLEPLGIRPMLEAGVVRCTLNAVVDPRSDGPPRLDVVLDGFEVRDGERALLELGRVAATGLSIDPASGAIEVGAVEGSGPSLVVRRLADGSIELPGVRYSPAGSPGPGFVDSEPVPAAAAPAACAGRALPPFRIGRLSWSGVRLRFEDLATPGAAPFGIEDAGLEVSGVAFDPRQEAGDSTPGAVRAWLRAPGLADRVDVSGSLVAGPGSLAGEIAITAAGLRTVSAAPYLSPLGIEPILQDGSLEASVTASLAQAEGGLRIGGGLAGLSLRDGERVLAAVEAAGVEHVELSPARVSLGAVRLAGVDVDLARDRDGAIVAAGFRIPHRPSDQSARFDPLEALAALGVVSMAGVTVEDVNVGWSDDAAMEPVRTRASVDAVVGPLALNDASAAPTPFTLRVGASGLAERIEADGTLLAGGQGVSLAVELNGRGMNAAGGRGYLPRGVEASLGDGRLRAGLKAALRPAAQGGHELALAVERLDYREESAEAPLAKAESLSVEIERYDPEAGVIHVRRVSATGLGASVERSADGAISLLGVRVGGAAGSGPEQGTPPSDLPDADAEGIVAAAHAPPPQIVVGGLDIGVDRVTFFDRARPGAAPVSLASARFWTEGEVRLLGAKPEENPPVRVRAEGRVDPVVGSFSLGAEIAPFAQRPTVSARLEASGLDGAGLEQVAPEIAEFVSAASLRDGRFRTELEAEAAVRRRGPLDFDLSRGVDVEFTLTETALTLGEDGPVLARVGKVYGERVRIEPATGAVAAKLVEVTDLAGHVWRDEAGVHVLGVLVRPPGHGPDGSSASPPAAGEPAGSEASAVAAGESPEVRIERLTVSGLDFRFEDRAVTPPVVVPIVALDADVRGVSSQMMRRERPVRFSVSALAGKVSLPRPVRGGVITGALSDLGKGREDVAVEMEDREFFSQCIASGSIVLHPVPRGRVLASISGLELTAIRGLAQAAGASVGGGVFDGRVEINAQEDGVGVRSKLVLTDLRYSEPPQGPIARFINLPVPLDAAIKAVEAPDGSITLPLEVTLHEPGVTAGDLIGAVAGATGQILATAVISAPVKVVKGFAGLWTDTKGGRRWVEEEPLVLDYAPGVASLDAAAEKRLSEVFRRARRDKRVQVAIEHTLGTDDAELASRRANPSADEAGTLAEDLRRRRAALLERRSVLAARAPAAALGEPAHAAELRAVNEELSSVEEAFDQLHNLLAPGADRFAARRARAAAVQMADARLRQVRELLDAVAGPAGAARVAVATPTPDHGQSAASQLIIRVRRSERR